MAETLAVTLLMRANQYKREAREAATATGQITRSAGGAQTATGKLDKQMTGLATTAKIALAGAAATAMVQFGRDSVRAATDLNESINAVNVVFGEAADGVLALGRNSADSLGLANSEFNSFAVRFSNFAQTIARGSGANVVDVVDDITGRIADFASVMNLDMSEAGDIFQSIMAGSSEVGRRFGLDLSAATVAQFALANGLADTTSELTEQDKVLARYQLLMEQTNNTAGDFKNTQDDLANATRTLGSKVENTKASIGEALVPTLENLAGTAQPLVETIGLLAGAFGSFQSKLDELGESDNATVAFLAEIQKGSFQGALPFFVENVERLVAVFEGAPKLFDKTAGALEKNRSAAGDAAAALEEVTSAQEAAKRAAERHMDALKRQTLIMQGIGDPVRGFLSDLWEMEAAQTAVTEAETEFGLGSREYAQSLVDRSAANDELKQSYLDLISDGIDPTSAAAQHMFDGMGFDQQLIDEIMVGYEELRRQFQARALALRIPVSMPTFTGPITGSDGSVVGWNTGARQSFHGGGVVQGQGEQLVRVMAGETVLPTHNPSFNRQMEKAASGTHITIGTVYGWDDFVRKVRDAGVEIQRT